MSEKELEYNYCVLEGTAYEAGQQLGNMFAQDKELLNMITGKIDLEQFKLNLDRYEQLCPGINDEIKGFADAVGLDPASVAIYYAYLCPTGNCSQIALRPEVTSDSHCLLGRNYDYSWNDRPVLVETHIAGQFRHIGFGCQLFGRFDGMNEKGLCISTSAGVINPAYNEEGFVFPVVVRAILNCCSTVDEAIDIFQSIKFADYRNFMVTDNKGDSVLIEAAGPVHTLTRKPVLYVTNHYNSKPLSDKNYYKPAHSLERYKCLKNYFASDTVRYDKNTIQRALSSHMPDGVCCNYYEDGMGTMWSIVFDSTDVSAKICFGDANSHWEKYNLQGQPGRSTYKVLLHSSMAPEGFWEHIQEK